MITKQIAIAYLAQRYEEQCDKSMTLRNDVPKEEYIRVNLPYALRNLRKKEVRP
jgi:hypothetical protein